MEPLHPCPPRDNGGVEDDGIVCARRLRVVFEPFPSPGLGVDDGVPVDAAALVELGEVPGAVDPPGVAEGRDRRGRGRGLGLRGGRLDLNGSPVGCRGRGRLHLVPLLNGRRLPGGGGAGDAEAREGEEVELEAGGLGACPQGLEGGGALRHDSGDGADRASERFEIGLYLSLSSYYLSTNLGSYPESNPNSPAQD